MTMQKGLWGIPLAAGVALLWMVYALNSGWYSEQVDAFGEDHSGLCIGGPALMFMILIILGFEMWADRRRRT